ncbi:MAG: hypothetical protein ACXW1Y_09130 [Acidimicrobiia bacterium]
MSIPAFGGYQLRHVDRMALEEWVADLQASGLGSSGIGQGAPGAQQHAHPRRRRRLFLDADQVERLATSIREPYGTLVYLLAYGGLRWGEAAALRRGCCDLQRYTHLFPSDVDDLVRRLADIRVRSLAAQPRSRDRSRGIELGGR